MNDVLWLLFMALIMGLIKIFIILILFIIIYWTIKKVKEIINKKGGKIAIRKRVTK